MAEEEIQLDSTVTQPSVPAPAAATTPVVAVDRRVESNLYPKLPNSVEGQQPAPAGEVRQRSKSESSNASPVTSRMGADLAKRPTRLFKRKQIFVEMDELRGDIW